MKASYHARNSSLRYGGKAEDYFKIHEFMDYSCEFIKDNRHASLLHSDFGISLALKVFGEQILNSDNVYVKTSDIIEDHIIEDFGFIPTIEEWFEKMTLPEWAIHIGKLENVDNTKIKIPRKK